MVQVCSSFNTNEIFLKKTSRIQIISPSTIEIFKKKKKPLLYKRVNCIVEKVGEVKWNHPKHKEVKVYIPYFFNN